MRGLERIPTIGIFCLFLRLREQVTPFFWVNTHDPRVPFAGMIEYTNLNPLPELGGDRILYVPQYLSADDPRYAQSDEEVLRAYTDALALINPAFDRRWVRLLRRVPRPLRAADLPDRLPHDHALHPDAARRTCSSPTPRQLHPHDRTISGSFGLGIEAARLAGAVLEGTAVRTPTGRGPGRGRAMNVEEYGRMYEAEETQWWYAGMRAISLSLLGAEWRDGDAEGRRILDAGCGTGNNLAHFRRFGRTVGVDLSDGGAALLPEPRRGRHPRQPPVPSLSGRHASTPSRPSTSSITAGWRTTGRRCARSCASCGRAGSSSCASPP